MYITIPSIFIHHDSYDDLIQIFMMYDICNNLLTLIYCKQLDDDDNDKDDLLLDDKDDNIDNEDYMCNDVELDDYLLL